MARKAPLVQPAFQSRAGHPADQDEMLNDLLCTPNVVQFLWVQLCSLRV
jgi:hypothetical protein